MEELVRLIRERARSGPRDRPKLRVVRTSDPPELDPAQRSYYIRRIGWMAQAYRLQWLVDQETWEVGAVDRLDDEALRELLRDMERARECLRDGIAYDDAGLVRSG